MSAHALCAFTSKLHQTVTLRIACLCYTSEIMATVKELLKQRMDRLYRVHGAHEEPSIHAALDELCAKAGIQKPLLCSPKRGVFSKLEHYFFDHGLGVMWPDEPRIFIGESFKKKIGHYDSHAPISDEFKSALAHEIGHLKYRDLRFVNILQHSPFLGAITGIAGVWFHEHLLQQKKVHIDAGSSEADAHHAMIVKWEQSNHVSGPHEEPLSHFVTAAKYISGALLGFGVGVGAYALQHRRMEFRADRVSAELMGDGKPLARALRMLTENHQLTAKPSREIIEEFNKQSWLEKLLNQLTHPSDAERIAKLEAWSR